MPSIYGSTVKSKFLVFQELNTKKKKHDSSFIFLDNESFDLYKFHENTENFKFRRKKYNTLLGLSVESSKKFNPDYMDPLICDSWIVSSYGDILNGSEIMDDFDPKVSNYMSSDVISILLEYTSYHAKNEVKCISESLSLIKGSFSAWMYNFQTANTFIVKCGHELHADIYNNDFSTLPFKGSEPLNDGEIYQLTREGITHVGFFDFLD